MQIFYEQQKNISDLIDAVMTGYDYHFLKIITWYGLGVDIKSAQFKVHLWCGVWRGVV